LKCDGSPDPTAPSEINTFLTLWKEQDEDFDLKASFANIELALAVNTINILSFRMNFKYFSNNNS
jgi:hypothetical protein